MQKYTKDHYQKVRHHCHCTDKNRGVTHSICNLKYNVPNEIPIVFHNRWNHSYHFILKELAIQFEEKFICLDEDTDKKDKNGGENLTTISYKIKFIDGWKFMASSLSNLFDNPGERIHKIKCKFGDNKNMKHLEWNTKNVSTFLNT